MLLYIISVNYQRYNTYEAVGKAGVVADNSCDEVPRIVDFPRMQTLQLHVCSTNHRRTQQS